LTHIEGPFATDSASLYLTKEIIKSLELSGVVVPVKRWTKIVGFLLILGVLAIVIAPDLDLPPTLTRSNTIHKLPLAAIAVFISASIFLSDNSTGSLSQIVPHRCSDLSLSLIDLNCTRLC